MSQIINRIFTYQGGGHDLSIELHLTCAPASKYLVVLLDGTCQVAFSAFNCHLLQAFHSLGVTTCTNTLQSQNGATEDFAYETEGKICAQACDIIGATNIPGCENICLLGTGNGAATALYVAAKAPVSVVSLALCGGRLSQALVLAAKNTSPTLFLLGSEDRIAADANRAAYASVRGPKEFSLINGAGHLLREPGSPEEIARRSTQWFQKYS